MHRIFCLQHGWQDFPVVIVKPKSKKKKSSSARTHLGLPHPTCTQRLCAGSSCTRTSSAPSPSHTLQSHSALLPHWPLMPSEPPLPERSMQRPCAATAALAASTELPTPRPFCSSWPLSKQPCQPRPFIGPPPPLPFFGPLGPPHPFGPSQPLLPCGPSQPLLLFRHPPPTASVIPLSPTSPSPARLRARGSERPPHPPKQSWVG